MQKAFIGIHQKCKCTQSLKNIRKKQNERTQIDATNRFYSQKKQAQTRATKLAKKFANTTKQNWFCQINTFKKFGAQEEVKHGTKNCEKLASDTKINMRTTKLVPSEEFGLKY